MKAVDIVKKNWYLVLLIIIVIMAFQIRAAPAVHNELQALDPFYLYRISEYVLNNNLQMPTIDHLRNHPYGDTTFDLLVMHYLPPLMYLTLNPVMQTSFFNFALLYPAIMGALSVFIMFFLAREIFNDNKAGLFAAFFLATVQAFITRTSAGFFEKEPTSSIFMFMSVLFFIKAFKSKDWRFGILSGITLGFMTLSWGGTQYIYVLFAIFALMMALINYDTKAIAYSYIPAIFIGIFMPYLIQPFFVSLFSTTRFLALGVLGIIVLKYVIEKFKLVKTEQIKLVTPGILVIGSVVFLIGSMFTDFMYNILQGLINLLTFQSTVTTTVAESIGGNWGTITSQTSLGAALGQLGPIASFASLFSLWTFSVIGLLILLYKLYSTRNMILIIPILWLILAVFGVFFAIRLIYFMGPTVALLSGFLFAWLLDQSYKLKITKNITRRWQVYLVFAGIMGLFSILYMPTSLLIAEIFAIPAIIFLILGYLINRSETEKSLFKKIHDSVTGNREKVVTITTIPVIIIAAFTLSFYTVNAYTYSTFLGPSISQPWYEAMDFLRLQTPQNSSVLSWWDFGYWFQTRGQRASIVDGGGIGNTSRLEVALWFTSNSENWTDHEPWLIDKLDVDYILMDFTLPGKYGAITKIASHETNIIGILQLQQTNTIPQGNQTIYEFRNGPYVIWLPIQNGIVTSSPMLLLAQGNQFGSQSYINDICTSQGIIRLGEQQPDVGGCVAITRSGIFFVPPEAEHTIFANLMFMDGFGLPLEKQFDNNFIKIYKVSNNYT